MGGPCEAEEQAGILELGGLNLCVMLEQWAGLAGTDIWAWLETPRGGGPGLGPWEHG